MGNCAAIQVGAYVDSCAGKPCSPACPINPCAMPGYICNSGTCNQAIAPGADCSLTSNICTPSCWNVATCEQCQYKPGCECTGKPCSTLCPSGSCPTGEKCVGGSCASTTTNPCLGKPCSYTCPIGSCDPGLQCIGGSCADPCAGKACSPSCPSGSCAPGLTCTNYLCTDPCAYKSCSTTCPNGTCPAGQLCTNGTCVTQVIVDQCEGKPCSTGCPYGSCTTGQSCTGGKCVAPVAPDYDTYGCNKAIGETYCASRMTCHIESEDPCNPIVPIGSGTTGGGTTGGGTTGGGTITIPFPCDGLNRNGSFDYTCAMEGQNSLMLILGIALLGGFVMLSSRK